MAVVKLRGSQHSKEIRSYEITGEGLVLGEALTEYRDLLVGVPRKIEEPETSHE